MLSDGGAVRAGKDARVGPDAKPKGLLEGADACSGLASPLRSMARAKHGGSDLKAAWKLLPLTGALRGA